MGNRVSQGCKNVLAKCKRDVKELVFETPAPYAGTESALHNCHSAVYVTDDKVKYLQVRVKLRKTREAPAAADVTESRSGDGTGDGGSNVDKQRSLVEAKSSSANTEVDELVEQTVVWQEKVFGVHEVDAIREEQENPTLRKKIPLSPGHENQIIGDPDLKGLPIFTKIEEDDFHDVKVRLLDEFTLMQALTGKEPKQKRIRRPKMYTALDYKAPKVMYILAAVGEVVGADIRHYEVVLGSISVASDHAGINYVEIRPPLKNQHKGDEDEQTTAALDNPHFQNDEKSLATFQLPGGSVYEYHFENVSTQLPLEDHVKINERLKKVDAKSIALRKNLAGHGFEGFEFHHDEEDIYSVFGEIYCFEPFKTGDETFVVRNLKSNVDVELWEQNCMYKSCNAGGIWGSMSGDTYYVVYEFMRNTEHHSFKYRADPTQMPAERFDRKCTAWSQMAGGTSDVDNSCIFNHPFELHYAFKDENYDDILRARCPVRMIMQVYNRDAWGRNRFIGYTYCDVPMQAGKYEISCKCWAPAGSTVAQLTNKFCGATPGLLDPRYTVTNDGNLPLLNRGFLKTNTTDGRVRMIFNIVKHTRIQRGSGQYGAQRNKIRQAKKVGFGGTETAGASEMSRMPGTRGTVNSEVRARNTRTTTAEEDSMQNSNFLS